LRLDGFASRMRAPDNRLMNAHPPLRILAAVALCLLCAPPPATAADWREVGVDEDGNRFAIDESTLRREAGRVRLTVRTEYAKPREEGTLGELVLGAIDRLVVDCELGRFALESRVYRTADLREVPALARARDELVFRAAPQRSISADIVERACQR
jgi:hypothetical protein